MKTIVIEDDQAARLFAWISQGVEDDAETGKHKEAIALYEAICRQIGEKSVFETPCRCEDCFDWGETW